MTGSPAPVLAETAGSLRDPVLVVESVTKRYGRSPAVRDLSLAVADGEHVALVGPSGCGKSSTLRLVAGLEQPDEGNIWIGGTLVAGSGAWQPVERRRVGLVFQDHALFPHLTVAGNVAFGLAGAGTARRRARVGAVLDLVEMTRFAGRYPHELSGGEQQRAALARALAPEPAVVLLDEPFSDLDRNLRVQIRADVTAILREAGTTAVFVTHDQQEALAIGDRVAVLRAGRIEQLDGPERVFHTPVNRFVATFMGDADFLPAHREGNRLLTEAGAVPVPAGLPGTGDIEVMARPHEVTLHLDPQGDARVIGAEFQGGFILYQVQLGSGRTLRSLQPHTTGYCPGTRLAVTLAHGHAPTVLVGDEAVGRG